MKRREGRGKEKKKQLKRPEVAIKAEREGESGGEKRRENTGRRRPTGLEKWRTGTIEKDREKNSRRWNGQLMDRLL